MSAYNIALLSAPTTIITAGTASTATQLAYSSNFLEFKNAGSAVIFVKTGLDNTVTAATTWTNPTQSSATGTSTPILPGEIAIYRHSPLPATAKDGGVWVAAISSIANQTLYVTPTEGK